MTRNATCLLLALGCATPAAAETWQGTLRCDIIPNVLTRPLVQPFRLDVAGGVARCQRDVRIPDTSVPSGYQETGQGPVGPGGRLTLKGSGLSNASGYDSEYSGILPPSGATTLTGFQHWHFDRRPPFDRPCTITLGRLN